MDSMLERFQFVVAAKTPLVNGNNNLDDLSAPRFDVQGRIPDAAPPDQQYAMLRALLAERFSLRAHRESRPTPVYVLTVAREGRLGPRPVPSSVNCAVYRSERSRNPQLEESRREPRQTTCWWWTQSRCPLRTESGSGIRVRTFFAVFAFFALFVSQKSVGIGRRLPSQSLTSPSFVFRNPIRQPREPSRSGWHRTLI